MDSYFNDSFFNRYANFCEDNNKINNIFSLDQPY